MPRGRAKPEPVVIPTNSVVASAARYPGKATRIYRPNQSWQEECYRHYSICGEARFAARFMGSALSKATLSVAKPSPDGPVVQAASPAAQSLEALFHGADGQAQMLTALGVHLTIGGECYLVGRARVEDKDTGEVRTDVWEVVSILEMKVTGTKWSIDYGNGNMVPLDDNDVVIRIWLPNPAKRIEADSPFRSVLPILTEIEWLTRHIFAQTSSRLAGAGLLMLPQGMSFPPPPNVDGAPPETANDADAFMLTLADAMLTPIEHPESPSAMVPIVVTAPADSIDKVKLMHFWSDLDAHALEMRSEAIRRFATGMDMPPEQILGLSSSHGTGGGKSNGVSHWGAWQIEESTIKMNVEPMLELVANAITVGYIRVLDPETDEFVIADTSSLRLRPDRSKEAFELYDRGALSRRALLRENGFEDVDLPDDAEFKEFLLRKVATGSATPEQVGAALKMLGVDLPITAPLQGETTQPPQPPSLEDHPTRPRTPDPELLAASHALVFRALERAGNRIRQHTGVKPPGVPSYAMHTMVTVNGQADKFLEDAWSCAREVLGDIADVETTVRSLDSYCRALFASQEPHSKARLTEWMSRVGR